jgi:ribosomal protein L30/L7E
VQPASVQWIKAQEQTLSSHSGLSLAAGSRTRKSHAGLPTRNAQLMAEPIRTLFITLKRSFAGTRESHRHILESLGFRYRQQTVERANMGSIRGALDKACRPPKRVTRNWV